MNGKHERMKLVARQSQLLSSITELAVSLRRPPQDVVPALFLRLDVSIFCRGLPEVDGWVSTVETTLREWFHRTKLLFINETTPSSHAPHPYRFISMVALLFLLDPMRCPPFWLQYSRSFEGLKRSHPPLFIFRPFFCVSSHGSNPCRAAQFSLRFSPASCSSRIVGGSFSALTAILSCNAQHFLFFFSRVAFFVVYVSAPGDVFVLCDRSTLARPLFDVRCSCF